VRIAVDGAGLDADAVVLALPLSVLRTGGVDLAPGLPAPVQDALDTLGSGAMEKVVLRFERPFWDAGAHVVGLTGTPHGRFLDWYDVSPLVGSPTLVGFTVGDAARDLTTWNDRDVVAAALRTLRAAY
jgi:monoamine oxidase